MVYIEKVTPDILPRSAKREREALQTKRVRGLHKIDVSRRGLQMYFLCFGGDAPPSNSSLRQDYGRKVVLRMGRREY